MFTKQPPDIAGGVRLFYSDGEARAIGSMGRVYMVAVHYDALLGRILPLEPVPGRPGWIAPASHAADASIVATAPIPRLLYLTPI